MLEKTDHPMVWGKTAGRPRSFAQAAENITGHDADDAQAAQLDLQAEAADHSDDDDATPSTLVVTKHCPKEMWDEIYAWGCKALDYAETVAWGHCTHGGFRPFNALGVASARKAWQDAHQNGRRKWCRGNFHHATLLFPLDGLATKVLGDRIAELLELTEMMTPETFVSRFFPIPIVPRVGGAAKMVSCLHHRSMILGSDLAPVKHPVQYVHAIERRLTKICRRVARAVGEPEVPLSWPVVENVLCCFSKVWERNLDVGSHAIY